MLRVAITLLSVLPLLRYTVLRLALFAAVTAPLYAAGGRGMLLVAGGVLVSGILSLVLLSRSRDEVSVALTAKVSRWHGALDAAARAEDDPPRPSSGN